MRGPRWRSASLLVVTAALLAAACGDDGPSGPGELEGSVVAPAEVTVGAVVMTLHDPGLREVLSGGDTRVFSAPAGTDSLRVLLMNTDGSGSLRFRLRVEDVGAAPPTASILDAVDAENDPLSTLAGIEVEFSR